MKNLGIKQCEFCGLELRRSLVIVLVMLMMDLTGCASLPTKATSIAIQRPLEACPENSGMLWWEIPGFSWYDYHRIMLDPVAMDIETSGSRFKPGEIEAFAADVDRSIADVLQPEFIVVDRPGPGVLRIRAVITGIETSNPALNVLSMAAVFLPLDRGGASVEVEFLDSMTNECVAAMVDSKTGSLLSVVDGLSHLGDARCAVKAWAKELKLALVKNP